MSDNKIVLDVKIEAAESAKTVKELKTALKDLINEQSNVAAGSKEFKKLADAINDTEGKIGDLNDGFRTLTGSGIEKTRSSIGLLKEGFANFDMGKIGIGLKGLASAFRAVPVLLLVEGITYITQHFDELSKGSGLLAKGLRFIGDIIDGLTDLVYKFTDALGLTNSELDKQGEAIKTNADKATEALGRQTAEYDRQISIAKASGKNSVDLEIAKQKAIIETNKALVQQTIEYVRNGGVLNDEQKKLLTGQLEAIKGAVAQEQVITLNANTQKKEDYKKHLEDLNKLGEENLKRFQKQQADAKLIADQQAFDDAYGEFLNQQQILSDAKIQAQIDEDERLRQLNEANDVYRQKHLDQIAKEEIEAHKKVEEAKQNLSIDLTSKSIAASQNITDAFFAYKLNGVKKGSAEELKIAKQQFETNKKLQLAQATIQGIQSVLAAFSSGSAIPIIGAVAGPAYAVLAGIAAAANIAKIANTKFEGGGSTGAASISSGSVANIPIPAPPTINTPSANTGQTTTFDDTGKKIGPAERQSTTINVNANIGVDEVNKTQKRVNVLEQQSTF